MKGDSGKIFGDLPPTSIDERFDLIYKYVSQGVFSLEDALESYGLTKEQYIIMEEDYNRKYGETMSYLAGLEDMECDNIARAFSKEKWEIYLEDKERRFQENKIYDDGFISCSLHNGLFDRSFNVPSDDEIKSSLIDALKKSCVKEDGEKKLEAEVLEFRKKITSPELLEEYDKHFGIKIVREGSI